MNKSENTSGIEKGAPAFTFGQVRSILASFEGVHFSKIKTLEARLQQLQKLGLPRGTNVGRSGRARYEGWQIAELALYLNLIDAGLSPTILPSLVASGPFFLMGGFGRIAEHSSPQYLLVFTNALGSLRSADPARAGPHSSDAIWSTGPDLEELQARAQVDPDKRSPPIVVDLARFFERLKSAITETVPTNAGQNIFPPTAPYPGKLA